MFKKIWDFISDLKITFWILNAITVLLVAGFFHSKADYHFFEKLNYMPLTRWFSEMGLSHPEKSWWVALLYLAMTLLAVNAVSCAIERLKALWPSRKTMTVTRFLTVISPSIIHLLFVAIMGGHLLTFQFGDYQRYPVAPGSRISLPNGASVHVKDIKPVNYPDGSHFEKRLRDAVYAIEVTGGTGPVRACTLSFLEPLGIDNFFLHPDVSKKTDHAMTEKGSTVCNRAEVKNTGLEGVQFYIVYSRDPGLPVIITLLLVISAVMLWYYISLKVREKSLQ